MPFFWEPQERLLCFLAEMCNRSCSHNSASQPKVFLYVGVCEISSSAWTRGVARTPRQSDRGPRHRLVRCCGSLPNQDSCANDKRKKGQLDRGYQSNPEQHFFGLRHG
eukprot:g67250.t1